jgi:hypothetical protein
MPNNRTRLVTRAACRRRALPRARGQFDGLDARGSGRVRRRRWLVASRLDVLDTAGCGAPRAALEPVPCDRPVTTSPATVAAQGVAACDVTAHHVRAAAMQGPRRRSSVRVPPGLGCGRRRRFRVCPRRRASGPSVSGWGVLVRTPRRRVRPRGAATARPSAVWRGGWRATLAEAGLPARRRRFTRARARARLLLVRMMRRRGRP